MKGKGTKLGEGMRDFYIRDFFHFWDPGFLHLGLFRLGKVRGPTVITIVNSDCNLFIVQASDFAGYRFRLAYQIFTSFLNLISLFINHNQLRTKSYNETFFFLHQLQFLQI